jgi:uncharacterized damage-inducible protein DinB
MLNHALFGWARCLKTAQVPIFGQIFAPNLYKMKEIYVQYAKYNLWANRRMVAAFSGLSDEQMETQIESSFPSARLTFLHIWDAEYLWLNRLQGVSLGAFPSKGFEGRTKSVFETLLKTSTDFLEFVEAQPASFFDAGLSFRTLSYGEQSQQAYEMVHHCMNHSTLHRGQLLTIGRQLGLTKFQPTDFIFYLRTA